MYGNTKIIFVNAKQAKTYYNYKNNKRKMYRINAAIWYNKKCKLIKPIYDDAWKHKNQIISHSKHILSQL